MSKATGDLLSHFEAKEIEGSPPPPSWNVAPTQDVPIIAEKLDEDGIDLIPAEGYYEWQKTEDGKKVPNYLYSETDDVLAFGGLYEFWPDPALPEDDPHRWLLSCTVLTTTAHDVLGHVHERAPLIIPRRCTAGGLTRRQRTRTQCRSCSTASRSRS